MGGAGANEAEDAERRDFALPVELAFLQRHGLSPSGLSAAATRATRNGTSPLREAYALRLIDEDRYYRAFAAELALPFCENAFALAAGGEYEAVLRAGIAPGASSQTGHYRFILAPQEAGLRRMIEAGPRARDDVAVTTPRRFAKALRLANASDVALHAANLDEAGLVRDSARLKASRGQKIAAGVAVAAAALGGVLAPLEAFFTLALLLCPVFLGLILLRLAASIEPEAEDLWRTQRWRLDDARLPVYTVAIPLYREEAVLDQMLRGLAALDYPAAKLDIRLLIEADDDGMRAALARLRLPAHVTVAVMPPGQPRTKPRALNLALREARGTLFTIFDAEDIPDPQQLRLAAARFQRAPAELACLQARLVIDHAEEGLLPALFALEYASLFEVLNPGLLTAGLPIMLGGTSNHFRTQALRAVGGWDAWNVTEDADLGLRLVRAGYRMGDLPSDTREEAPVSIKAWLRQRSRWIKGYMQTAMTHSRAPLALLREAGPAATITFTSLIIGTIVTALGFPIFALATIAAYWEGSVFSPPTPFVTLTSAFATTVWLLGAVALFAPPAVGAIRRRDPGLLLLLPILPLYYGLVSIAAWMAFYEFFARRFAWNKTEHGLARRRQAPGASEEPRSGAAIRPPPAPAAARY
ncbi:glycosyltransferase [Bosea sp. TND4EK4]|uniref:glycosyltransferase n=1 Tax=Bosea sp. TND4EK4 TaxID=1907408 RepID=UPI000956EBFB|nr:glycosyltransferase [Bosea sp. TND4EK4]SIQ97547.1 Glycosyltransferase, catalytic subunit of cellulose synthase and poly-beta-1,6-N-acetylglucosamine synthase [Bosea sp. TND4EK4]